MKMYWGVQIQLHAFLTLALDGGEWSASCPSKEDLGPRASLNTAAKRRILTLYQKLNCDHSPCSLVAMSYPLSLHLIQIFLIYTPHIIGCGKFLYKVTISWGMSVQYYKYHGQHLTLC